MCARPNVRGGWNPALISVLAKATFLHCLLTAPGKFTQTPSRPVGWALRTEFLNPPTEMVANEEAPSSLNLIFPVILKRTSQASPLTFQKW